MFPFPITLARYRFSLEAIEQVRLPAYAGSTIRGGFGVALRRVTCALRRQDCAGCLLVERCVYAYIFETPVGDDPGILRAYPQAPHPFVIEPPIDPPACYEKGEVIPVGLTLIGRAVEYLPYFIYAFDELGANAGLGKGRGKFRLRTVDQEKSPGSFVQIYCHDSKTISGAPAPLDAAALIDTAPAPQSVEVFFITPTRLKYEGALTTEADHHILLRNLLRRISALSRRHCGGSETAFDFRGIIERSKAVSLAASELQWRDWERYSSRQDTKMRLGGFVGRVVYSGDLKESWPFLKVGEAVHVGKGATFGLGMYQAAPTVGGG